MISGLLFLPVVLLYLIPFLFPGVTKPLFVNTSYYFMLGVFIWWLYSAFGYLKEKFNGEKGSSFFYSKEFRVSFIISLFAAALCFLTNEIAFKVNSDETNLLSISRSMYLNKTTLNGTMGKFYYDNLNVFNYEVPKRPLFFPFITSLFHNLTGYSKYSPFVVNFISLFGVFFVSVVGLRKFSLLEKLSVAFLILSFPIFSIYATSAGFDIFSALFLLIVIKLCWEFYKRQESHVWSLLVPSLLIYAHIRYESIMFSGFILIFLLITKKYSFKNILNWPSVKLFIIGYFPQLLQRLLSVGKYENPEGRAVLSLISVKEHGALMLKNLVNFDGILPYNTFVTFLTPLLIIALLVFLIRKKEKLGDGDKFALFIVFFGIANTLLFLSHHAGLYDHPTQARFFFTFCMLGIVLLISFYLKFKERLRINEKMLFLASFFMFLYFYPKAVEGRFMNKLVINRDLKIIYKFVEAQKDASNLYVYSRPGQLIPLNLGAVNHSYAKNNWSKLKSNLKAGLFANIYIISKDAYTEKDDRYYKGDVSLLELHQSSHKKKISIYKVKR